MVPVAFVPGTCARQSQLSWYPPRCGASYVHTQSPGFALSPSPLESVQRRQYQWRKRRVLLQQTHGSRGILFLDSDETNGSPPRLSPRSSRRRRAKPFRSEFLRAEVGEETGCRWHENAFVTHTKIVPREGNEDATISHRPVHFRNTTPAFYVHAKGESRSPGRIGSNITGSIEASSGEGESLRTERRAPKKKKRRRRRGRIHQGDSSEENDSEATSAKLDESTPKKLQKKRAIRGAKVGMRYSKDAVNAATANENDDGLVDAASIADNSSDQRNDGWSEDGRGRAGWRKGGFHRRGNGGQRRKPGENGDGSSGFSRNGNLDGDQRGPRMHSRRGRSPVLAKLLYGNDQQVRSALDELASGTVAMNIHEFNDILSTLNRQRKMRAAIGLVRVSRSSAFADHIGPKRTVKSFTIMLDIFGKAHQLDQAFALFYEMQREENLSPTQVTYNALISSCSRNNEPELAHEVFEDMRMTGLEGDKFTYASLIDAHAKRGDIDRAFEVADLMDKNGVIKDQTIYSALMEACGRARSLERALYVFEQMKRSGLWPNLISYAVLLDCCANAREPYKAFELFSDMKHWGLTSNVVTWTGLLHACAKAGWPERAEMVLQRMRDAGVEPNEITYGALVDGWTRTGHMERAFEAVRRMSTVDGVAPNAVLVGGLIEACRRQRDGRSVGKVWKLIKDHNLRPARSYYPTMVALAAWAGDVETATSISMHCYARGFLRRVAFNSRDPTLQALAYALVCVHKACEKRRDSVHLLERLSPIYDATAMRSNRATVGMSLDEVFSKVASSWETSSQADNEFGNTGRNGNSRGRRKNGSGSSQGRTTVQQMKERFLASQVRNQRRGEYTKGSSGAGKNSARGR